MLMEPRKIAERTQTVWTLGTRMVQTTVRWEAEQESPYRAYFFIHEDGGTTVREAEVPGRFDTFAAAEQAALAAAREQVFGSSGTEIGGTW